MKVYGYVHTALPKALIPTEPNGDSLKAVMSRGARDTDNAYTISRNIGVFATAGSVWNSLTEQQQLISRITKPVSSLWDFVNP